LELVKFSICFEGFRIRSLEDRHIFEIVPGIIMATIKRFEDLEIWQSARKLCQRIYLLTFEEPISKDFRYKDQIRGACGSTMDNIADAVGHSLWRRPEGFGRGSKLEFINSLTIVKGKAEELKSQLYRDVDIRYFSEPLFTELYNDADLLVKKTGAFINYLNKSKVKGQKFKGRIKD